VRKSVLVLLVLACAVLAFTTLSGCGGIIAPADSSSPSVRFASLCSYDAGGDPAVGAARGSKADRGAAHRAAASGGTSRNFSEAATSSAPANIYIWSQPVPGEDWLATTTPGDYFAVELSLNGETLMFLAVSNGYMQVFTAHVSATVQAISQVTQVTSDAADHWNAHISPDGSMVAFVRDSGDDSRQDLCLISTSGGTETCLSGIPGPFIAHPSWTPDGRIAFEAWGTSNSSATYKDEIYIVNPDGSNLTQITNNGNGASYDTAPSVSRDGTKMAVSTWGGSSGFAEVWVIDLTNGHRTQLTDGTKSGGDSKDPLFISTDQIVYVSQAASDTSNQLYLINADGSNLTRLTNNADDNYFDWDFL
jgi:Tol biopolymer transport system component